MKISLPQSPRVWMLLAVLLVLALLLVWVAIRSGPLAPVKVTVAEVEERAIAPALFGIGTVEARYTHQIGPTAPGRIASLMVDVGDRVEAGQVLAVIKPIDLDQRIAAASGSAGRSAALEQASASQVADASARLALARSEAARGEELFRGGWLTRSAIDQRRQALAANRGRTCRLASKPRCCQAGHRAHRSGAGGLAGAEGQPASGRAESRTGRPPSG